MVANENSLELHTASSGETVVTASDDSSDVVTIGGYQYNIANADQKQLHMLYKLQHQSSQFSQDSRASSVLTNDFQDEMDVVEDDPHYSTSTKTTKGEGT